MKKVLIIGAGFLQSFIIKKAKDMGYHTITIDKNPESPGFSYADEYSVIDIVDQEACLNFAQEKEIGGVITAATDYGVLSVAYIAEKMGLPGIDYKTAKKIKNKYLVRRILFENNIDHISQFYEIGSLGDIDKIREKIKYPVMVKPCDGSGSKAAKKVDNINSLKAACREALKASIIGKALIEDYIVGQEFGVESLVYDGRVYVLGVMGKHMTNPPDYAELGHFFPSKLDIEDKLKDLVKNAINVLGINHGGVNMDILITKDHRISIVDVGVRMGGNLIGSHIIPLGTGIDYMANLIRASMGDPIDLRPNSPGANIATRLLALSPGKVKALPDFTEISQRYKVDIHHTLEVGKTINPYHNNLDGCGYILAVSDDLKDAQSRAQEAKDLVDTSIIRE